MKELSTAQAKQVGGGKEHDWYYSKLLAGASFVYTVSAAYAAQDNYKLVPFIPTLAKGVSRAVIAAVAGFGIENGMEFAANKRASSMEVLDPSSDV